MYTFHWRSRTDDKCLMFSHFNNNWEAIRLSETCLWKQMSDSPKIIYSEFPSKQYWELANLGTLRHNCGYKPAYTERFIKYWHDEETTLTEIWVMVLFMLWVLSLPVLDWLCREPPQSDGGYDLEKRNKWNDEWFYRRTSSINLYRQSEARKKHCDLFSMQIQHILLENWYKHPPVLTKISI